MKKIFSTFLFLIIFTLLFSPTSFAKSESSSMSDAAINERLKKLGFTDEQIEMLSPEVKIDIANDPEAKELLSFEQVEVAVFEPVGLETRAIIDGEIQPLAISDSRLKLILVAVNLGQKNGVPHIRINSSYEWKQLPTWRLTDGLGIAWSPGWYADRYELVDQQLLCSSSTPNNPSKCEWNYKTIYSPIYTDRMAGVVFDIDLKFTAEQIKGYMNVWLLGNDKSTIQKTTYSAFNTKYGHSYIAPGISASVTPSNQPGVSASISFNLLTDTKVTDTSIRNSDLRWN